jgi:hypothetical protein
MTMNPKLKTILELRPFKRALICQIPIGETQVMLEKAYLVRVLVPSQDRNPEIKERKRIFCRLET